MDNKTDIILRDTGLLGQPRKIELDDPPDRISTFNQGVITILMFPSNPVSLVLDTLVWVNGSAVILSVASVWSPVALIWGLWAFGLILLSCVPSARLDPTLRLLAVIRLLLMCMGAVALLI